jgi:hypothetical protein
MINGVIISKDIVLYNLIDVACPLRTVSKSLVKAGSGIYVSSQALFFDKRSLY